MTRSRPVEPGQEYVSCLASPGDEDPYRIRVVGKPVTISGIWGFGKVRVVTVLPGCRETRERALSVDQLHDTATTRDGQPRRTGYILDTSKETP